MVSNPIAHARLIELLHYDQATGVFTRKVTTGYRGGRHKAGTIAGSRPKLGRYQDIKVDGVMYAAYVTAKRQLHEGNTL